LGIIMVQVFLILAKNGEWSGGALNAQNTLFPKTYKDQMILEIP